MLRNYKTPTLLVRFVASLVLALLLLLATPTHACSCVPDSNEVPGSFNAEWIPVVVTGEMGAEVVCDGGGRRSLLRNSHQNVEISTRKMQFEEPAPDRYFSFQFKDTFKGCDLPNKSIRFKGPGLVRTAGDSARCGYGSFADATDYILFGSASVEKVCGKTYTVVHVGLCSATRPLVQLTTEDEAFLEANNQCTKGGKP